MCLSDQYRSSQHILTPIFESSELQKIPPETWRYFAVHIGKNETQRLTASSLNLLVGLLNHPDSLGEKSNVLVHCCGNKEVLLSVCVLFDL